MRERKYSQLHLAVRLCITPLTFRLNQLILHKDLCLHTTIERQRESKEWEEKSRQQEREMERQRNKQEKERKKNKQG